MTTYGFVFARGGSKGLPQKNLRKLGGKTLVEHSIALALSMREIEEVFLSTDSEEIASVAEELGVEVIYRGPDLSSDYSPEWEAWQHAIKWTLANRKPFDCFLSVPPTAPLRSGEDIRNALELLCNDTDFVVTVTESRRSPWFNMLVERPEGWKRVIEPPEPFTSRQQAPKSYDMSTVAFVGRPNFILEKSSLWDGSISALVIPEERSIDIDTELDLRFAEFLFSKRHRD